MKRKDEERRPKGFRPGGLVRFLRSRVFGPRTITVDGRKYLHPSELPNYDPRTGTYRGGDPENRETELRAAEGLFARMRALGHRQDAGGGREGKT